eukprot:4559544-Pyramimonas_sp.AAC.1
MLSNWSPRRQAEKLLQAFRTPRTVVPLVGETCQVETVDPERRPDDGIVQDGTDLLLLERDVWLA